MNDAAKRMKRTSNALYVAHSRRGVSEVIATLLLMGVTVVGGVLAMTMVGAFTDSNNDFTNIEVPEELELIGYDSRDGPDLSAIGNLDNKLDSRLCTSGCNATPNNVPNSSGTDFIMIYLHNPTNNDIYLSTISIGTGSIAHSWDTDTSGQVLDASVNDGTAPHSYPYAGMYSIIPDTGSTPTQRVDTKIGGGEYARVVIKLSSEITDTLDIDDVIPITVGTSTGNSFKLFIDAGSID